MEMTFAQAVDKLIIGEKLRRLEWPDDRTYIVMINERLSIYKPETKNFAPLLVSLGDICGEDWAVVKQKAPIEDNVIEIKPVDKEIPQCLKQSGE